MTGTTIANGAVTIKGQQALDLIQGDSVEGLKRFTQSIVGGTGIPAYCIYFEKDGFLYQTVFDMNHTGPDDDVVCTPVDVRDELYASWKIRFDYLQSRKK